MSTSVSIPRFLINEIKNENCVLFLGSGASADAGLPSGTQLSEALSEDLDDSKRYSTLPLPEVAQAYVDQLDKNALLNKIMNIFKERKKPGTTHHLIAQIPFFTVIITTNWDTLVEDALSIYAIVDDVQYSVYYNQNVRQVLKIHGCITRPETVVATEDDYIDFFQGKMGSLIWNEFKTLLATKTVLYLGYSLADPNFGFLLREMRSSLEDFVKKGYAVQLDPPEHVKTKWLQRNISIISSTSENFLRHLADKLDL